MLYLEKMVQEIHIDECTIWFVPTEQGEIKIKGKPVKITNPNIANDLGIGMVHQHFMLVHNFTVTENIILGNEPKKKGKLLLRKLLKKFKTV